MLLKQKVFQDLKYLKKDLEKEKAYAKHYQNIKKFLDEDKDGMMDLDLLSDIPEDIIRKEEKDKFIETLKPAERMKDRSLFIRKTIERQMIINSFFQNLQTKCNQFSKKKNDSTIMIIEDTIKDYNRAYDVLTDYGINKICDDELIIILTNIISELCIDDIEIVKMLEELKRQNLALINKVVDPEKNVTSDEEDTYIYENGLELLDDSRKIISYFKSVLANYYELNISNEKYEKIFLSVNSLKQIIKDYEESMEIYLDSGEKDDEALKYFYNKMDKLYNILLEEKDNLELKQSINSTDEFYAPIDKIKNVIVFIPLDDKDTSYMEECLEMDENINNSHYNSIRSTLQRLMLGYDDAMATHKAKSDYYSENFLKEYHVKSIKNSKCRIIISRYSTTLKQKYQELSENPGVIFVFNAGYGYIDGNAKHDLYETGLNECYKHKNQIDQIRNLLNLDWSKLSETEALDYDSQIKKLFEIQKRKMNHFLGVCIQNQNGKNIK